MPDRNRTDPRRRPTSSLQAADVAKREAALYDGEERFRTLVQNIPDYAIFLLDINGVIIEWNEGAERVKGYTAEEVVGQHVSICYTPEQIAAGQPEKELAEAAREGRIETEGWRVRRGGSASGSTRSPQRSGIPRDGCSGTPRSPAT